MYNFIIPIGYIIDLIIGDPQWSWHPVRIIGKLIQGLEKLLNRGKINKLFSGIILVILTIGITLICICSILRIARLIHPALYYVVSILLIYFVLSIKALGDEAKKVYKALKEQDINGARCALSMIVGRDTDNLNEPEIIRATVETVAESIMDGIVAPLFYAFLGGPVLAWVYKAINTLDSMVGYRSERFIEFGWASAKVDGIVNFIPAKITMFLIWLSAWCYRKDGLNSMRWMLRELFKGPQDNSEATEAAMAGALGVQLGGLNFYHSVPIQKPFIGNNLYRLNSKHIQESVNLAYISSGLFMVIGIVLVLIIERR